MSYGYVYVAQIAMGADKNQTIKAIQGSGSLSWTLLLIIYALHVLVMVLKMVWAQAI